MRKIAIVDDEQEERDSLQECFLNSFKRKMP